MNTRTNPFHGLGVAVVTPFTREGAVDVPALEALLEDMMAGGANFFCILGTTAETPTLSRDEQMLVRQTALRVVAGRVPLLLGAGGNSTAEVCSRLASDDLKGFDGLLIVTPFYNKPTQEGLFWHFPTRLRGVAPAHSALQCARTHGREPHGQHHVAHCTRMS